jgi:hypothetical protein
MEKSAENTVLRLAMLALAAFMLVKLWQAGRQTFWSAFGIGWVLYWSGGLHFF